MLNEKDRAELYGILEGFRQKGYPAITLARGRVWARIPTDRRKWTKEMRAFVES
jgi:hypothetical protein